MFSSPLLLSSFVSREKEINLQRDSWQHGRLHNQWMLRWWGCSSRMMMDATDSTLQRKRWRRSGECLLYLYPGSSYWDVESINRYVLSCLGMHLNVCVRRENSYDFMQKKRIYCESMNTLSYCFIIWCREIESGGSFTTQAFTTLYHIKCNIYPLESFRT